MPEMQIARLEERYKEQLKTLFEEVKSLKSNDADMNRKIDGVIEKVTAIEKDVLGVTGVLREEMSNLLHALQTEQDTKENARLKEELAQEKELNAQSKKDKKQIYVGILMTIITFLVTLTLNRIFG